MRNALFFAMFATSHKPDKASSLSSFSKQFLPFQTCDLPFLHNYGQSQLCQLSSKAASTKRTTQAYFTRSTTRQYEMAVLAHYLLLLIILMNNSKDAKARIGTPARRQVKLENCVYTIAVHWSLYKCRFSQDKIHIAYSIDIICITLGCFLFLEVVFSVVLTDRCPVPTMRYEWK